MNYETNSHWRAVPQPSDGPDDRRRRVATQHAGHEDHEAAARPQGPLAERAAERERYEITLWDEV
jgi:hypothetical protein